MSRVKNNEGTGHIGEVPATSIELKNRSLNVGTSFIFRTLNFLKFNTMLASNKYKKT